MKKSNTQTIDMERRKALKSMGLLGVSLPLFDYKSIVEKDYFSPISFNKGKTKKKLKAIVCGAGNRGNVYGDYAVEYPEELDIVGVAEPIPIRQERFADKHDIKNKHRFETWEHVFDQKKFADVIIITTPDDLHHGPAMRALNMGYDLLLEKPIAQTWEECSEILAAQKKNDAIVAVCHVLRYSPYYRKVKEVLDSGLLGELISVQHFEPIQHVHMSHSFVRGNWGVEAETNPTILAKSCHDLDILRWWIDQPCNYISSFGSLKWFKESNAPEGSTARCTDGCKIEESCPYSALRIYHKNRTWLHHFDLPEDKEKHGDAIMENLLNGPYGRCVYRCDNDVVDHQVLAMEFENEITATFNMEAFTDYHGRKSRIMGSMGHIKGDGTELHIADFRNESLEIWNVKEHAKISSGHGGGDWGLMSDFLLAVDSQDASLLTSNLDASMESHQMGFLAEQSRKSKQTMKVDH